MGHLAVVRVEGYLEVVPDESQLGGVEDTAVDLRRQLARRGVRVPVAREVMRKVVQVDIVAGVAERPRRAPCAAAEAEVRAQLDEPVGLGCAAPGRVGRLDLRNGRGCGPSSRLLSGAGFETGFPQPERRKRSARLPFQCWW